MGNVSHRRPHTAGHMTWQPLQREHKGAAARRRKAALGRVESNTSQQRSSPIVGSHHATPVARSQSRIALQQSTLKTMPTTRREERAITDWDGNGCGREWLIHCSCEIAQAKTS